MILAKDKSLEENWLLEAYLQQAVSIVDTLWFPQRNISYLRMHK